MQFIKNDFAKRPVMAAPMTGSSALAEWRKLFRELTIPEHGETPEHDPAGLVVPTAAAEFERSIGYALPDSYKAFAQIFGPGELGGQFRINIPGETGSMNLSEEHANWKEGNAPYLPDQPAELLRRMVYFVSTLDGCSIGWDPLDVSDSEHHEYRTYFVSRACYAWAIAATFHEFVHEIALKDNLHKIFGTENLNPDDWPPQEFLPYRH